LHNDPDHFVALKFAVWRWNRGTIVIGEGHTAIAGEAHTKETLSPQRKLRQTTWGY